MISKFASDLNSFHSRFMVIFDAVAKVEEGC